MRYAVVLRLGTMALLVLMVLGLGGEAGAGTFPGKNGLIAFTSYDGNDREIYTIPIKGGAATQVTDNTTDDYDPSWSPDGKRIAYVSGGTGGSDPEIYAISRSGGSPKRITFNGDIFDYSPSWSPDGKKIAYASIDGNDLEIFTVSTSGASDTQITNNDVNDAKPSWSPDGERIAYEYTSDAGTSIVTMTKYGRDAKRIIINNTIEEYTPDWQTIPPRR